ncbi:MAG TPA: signal peptidase I [Myxococcota bacterium]|nr:signal peptidase I [Myxococcota bacterium]HRY96871.1 signal peptidase I [Myxococcota bacterium]
MGLPASSPRKPWLAGLLALVCPGLGHMYLGRLGLAALFAVLGWLAALSLPLEVVCFPGEAQLALQYGMVLAGCYWLLQAALAVRVAGRQARAAYRLRAFNRFITYFLFVVTGLVGLGVEAFLVRAHVLEVFLVPSSSMLPTLLPGDLVFVAKIGPEARAPQPGELIVFEVPYHSQPDPWVKRVVAVAGQQVQVRGGRLSVSGLEISHRPLAPEALRRPLPEAVLRGRRPVEVVEEARPGLRYAILVSPHGAGTETDEGRFELDPVLVPEGSVYVLGDARYNSRDSRNFGPVPLDRLIGRVAGLLWSQDAQR